MTEPETGSTRTPYPGGATQTLPSLDKDALAEPGRHRSGGRARRFVSARRVPAALVAAGLLVAAGALLYDVVAVRAGGQAQAWRRNLADELATRQLDSYWVLGGAAAAVVLGLWLIWLAVTPGLRSILPMRPPAGSPKVRSGLDRRAAALILRDTALRVPGVAAARVGVGRRKVKARVAVHFRDMDEVREELDEVFADSLERLGLARPPKLSLTTQRADGR